VSWVEFEDTGLGWVVVELQPTALEVFRARAQETVRFHLRMVAIEPQGPDGAGNQQVRLAVPNGAPGLLLSVPPLHWDRVWPLLEQARAAQRAFVGY
jgi:hypothetical protein